MIKTDMRINGVLTNALNKLNTALINKNVPVKQTNSGLACTDGTEVLLNIEEIKTLCGTDAEFITSIKGLNMHELGHIFITSYTADEIRKNVPSQSTDYYEYHKITNILEDIRLENFLINKYPFSVNYLNTAFSLLILPNIIKPEREDKQTRLNKFMIYSRLNYTDYVRTNPAYLKITGIYNTRLNTEFKTDAVQLDGLIKAYLITKDNTGRLKLAKKIYDIIFNQKHKPGTPEEENGTKGTDAHGQTEKSKEENTKEENKKEIKEDNTALKELITTIKKVLENNAKIQEEVKQIEEEVNKTNYPETPEVITAYKTLKRNIELLKNKPVKRYVHEQTRGKFSVKDFLKNEHSTRNFNKVFNKKEEQTKDALNMGVSLLIDASGSMNEYSYKTQLDTSYILLKALENTGNKTQLIEFSGNISGHKQFYKPGTAFKVLKSFNNRLKSTDFARHFKHGNEIIPPLTVAFKDMQNLNVSSKYVFVLTDGGITTNGNTEEEIRHAVHEFNKAGINVYCITVNNNRTEEYNIFNKEIKLNTFEEVNAVLKKLILDIQRDIILKAGK